MRILVTGGAGYIGSHTCVELLETGYDLTVIDNFNNSKPEALRRVERLTGKTIDFFNDNREVLKPFCSHWHLLPIQSTL